MVAQNLLLVLVLAPFVAAALAATLPAHARNAETWLAGLTMLLVLVVLGALYPEVTNGHSIEGRVDWIGIIGLDLTFRLDGFSWLFMVLVAGIGLMVFLYARYYMAPEDPVPRLHSCLLAFAGAMSGMVLSGNIIMLVVFWELTSLVSFLLIGYWYHRQDARDGARMSLIVTATGGLCLLVAMILIGQIAGSYDLETVLISGPKITAHKLYPVVLILFVLGAFTKSAQFPFHFWLPHAMAAPTPVSAYLHSATMVKAGVFVLLRFHQALGGTVEWFQIVTGTGLRQARADAKLVTPGPAFATTRDGVWVAGLWLPLQRPPSTAGGATAAMATPLRHAALPPLPELRANAAMGQPYAAADLIDLLLARYDADGDPQALFDYLYFQSFLRKFILNPLLQPLSE